MTKLTDKLTDRPLPERATFLVVVVGMAKDAGYRSPTEFLRDVRAAWPHVKPPTSEEIHEKRRQTRRRQRLTPSGDGS